MSSEKELEKLAEMIRKRFNPSLSDAEAMDSARSLVGVYKILLDVHMKQKQEAEQEKAETSENNEEKAPA